MGDLLANFLKEKKIDSYQKMRLLLYLYHHPGAGLTLSELAQRLYLGSIYVVMDIVAELHGDGLIGVDEDRYSLDDEPGNNAMIQRLAKAFEDPLARQRIFEQVQQESRSDRAALEYPHLLTLSERLVNAF